MNPDPHHQNDDHQDPYGYNPHPTRIPQRNPLTTPLQWTAALAALALILTLVLYALGGINP